MKVFIANKKIGCFWTAQKTWVSSMDGARDFERVIPATDCCKRLKLKDVELVLIFSGSQTAVRVDGLVRSKLKDKGLIALIGASLAFAGHPEFSCGAAHYVWSVMDTWFPYAVLIA
ncbi:MAG: hypothetical protein JWM16_430 [Verrucomicrobiales bacterium]|nr:hypothetical protein [Verrucomicrobiales bacterium]